MGDRDKKPSKVPGSYSIKTRSHTEMDEFSGASESSLPSKDSRNYRDDKSEEVVDERVSLSSISDSTEHTSGTVVEVPTYPSLSGSYGPSAEMSSASSLPSAAELMSLMFEMVKNQREETYRLRDEAERREAARKRERLEDINRLKKQWDEDAAWRKARAEDQDKLSRVHQAIKSFPKISCKDLAAAQLQNFRDLMVSSGLAESELTSRLPEVLTGQIALAWQNLKLPTDSPFEDAKRQLLHAVGFTMATATRSYLRPDPVDQNKKGAVDSVTPTATSRFYAGTGFHHTH